MHSYEARYRIADPSGEHREDVKVVQALNAEQAAWMVGYVMQKQVEVTSLHFLLPDGQRLDCSTDSYARLEEKLEMKRARERAADRVFTEMRFQCNTIDNSPWEHQPTEDGGVTLSCRIFWPRKCGGGLKKTKSHLPR